MIDSFGGLFISPYNLQNQASLEYILAAVSLPLFGRDRYPTLKEKAAAIASQIILRHVFVDGNKGTAVHIAYEFLRGNGVRLFLDPTVVDLAVDMASGAADYGDLLQWLHRHQ